MGDIEAAIAAIESREPGEKLVYQHFADRFGVSRTTLSRRHRGIQGSQTEQYNDARALHPRQEAELLKYIKKLTKEGLPPTKPMIRNFASPIAKRELSRRWVDRFCDRHRIDLISKNTTGIDRVRHQADSPAKYNEYFDLLYHKIKKYNVQPENTYNMDEKGCMIGVIGRSKRVFSRAVYEAEGRAKVIQDGNREWVTVLASVCADGSSLPYAIIYAAKNSNIQDNWVNDMDPEEDVAFVASSESGWTDNELGLAWLRDVFQPNTKLKAGRSWRLLILDGHGSHMTVDFIEYCHQNRILLMVYPPHSTHTLQPLDVALFKPLSTAYSSELEQHISLSHGILPVKKPDFFLIFRSAYAKAFTSKNITKSFKCTGIWPIDRSQVIDRFYTTPSPPNTLKDTPEAASQVSPTDWHAVDRLLQEVVKDAGEKIVRKLTGSIHRAATETKLLRHENKGLRTSLHTQNKRKNNGKRLPLAEIQVRNDRATGGATFWSPSKVKEARAIRALKQQEDEENKLQKARLKAEKAAKKVREEEEKEERAKARKLAKEVKEKELRERAAKAAKTKRVRAENNTKKAIKTSKKGKRKASSALAPKNKRQKASSGGAAPVEASAPASASPVRTTSRGRNVHLPAKFK